MRSRLRLLVFAAAQAITAAAHATTVAPADPTGRAATPGEIALLAASSADAAVAARIEAAIGASDPATRAAAARVVHVASLANLVPRIREAFRTEAERAPAREQARVLAALGDASDVAVLLAGAERLPELGPALAAILAREKGPAALDLLADPAFRTLRLGDPDRSRFLMLATREDGAELMRAFHRLLEARDRQFWSAMLALLRAQGYRVNAAKLAVALDVPDPVMRTEAAWFLAAYLRARPVPDPSALLATLEERGRLEPPPGTGPAEALGFELLARVLGCETRDHADWMGHADWTLGNRIHDLEEFGETAGPLLSERESEALAAEEQRSGRSAAMDSHEGGRSWPDRRPSLMRTAADLPPGMLVGTLQAAGCDLGSKVKSAVAAVRYDASGRPSVTRWLERPSGGDCKRAAEALMGLALAPMDEVPPAGSAVPVALLFERDAVACAEAATGGAPFAEARGRSRDEAVAMAAPELIEGPPPRYPDEAREAGVQGRVVVEAVISRTGCVETLRVLQTPVYELALAALEALVRWRFRPGKIDGRPVIVYFTLTANFNLR